MASDLKEVILMSMIEDHARRGRRQAQKEGVEALEAAGVLDELYAVIDSGELDM